MFLQPLPIPYANLPVHQRALQRGQAFNLVDYSPRISNAIQWNEENSFSRHMKSRWNQFLGRELYSGVDYNWDAKRLALRRRAYKAAKDKVNFLMRQNLDNDLFNDFMETRDVEELLALRYPPAERENFTNRYVRDRYIAADILRQYDEYILGEEQKMARGNDINHNFQVLNIPRDDGDHFEVNLEWAFMFENLIQLQEFHYNFNHYMNRILIEAKEENKSFEVDSVQFRIFSIPTANYVAIDPFVLATRSPLAVSPLFHNKYEASHWLESLFGWAEKWMNVQDRSQFDATDMDWLTGSYPRVEALFEMIQNLGTNQEHYYRSYVILTSVVGHYSVNAQVHVPGVPDLETLNVMAEDYGIDVPPMITDRQRKAIRTQEDLLNYFRRIHQAPSHRQQLFETQADVYRRQLAEANLPGPSSRPDVPLPRPPTPPPPTRERRVPSRYRE